MKKRQITHCTGISTVKSHGLTGARNMTEIPALTARSRWKNVLQRIHVSTRVEDLNQAKTRRHLLKGDHDVVLKKSEEKHSFNKE